MWEEPRCVYICNIGGLYPDRAVVDGCKSDVKEILLRFGMPALYTDFGVEG